jgi:hypothetical protein
MPHEKTEYEFKAKRLLDLVKAEFPGMGAMVFLMDLGEGGNLAYLSSIERVDAFTAILEWQVRTMSLMTKDQVQEMLCKTIEEWPE